jgi:alkyldihydroxyacetonephosphate synthase
MTAAERDLVLGRRHEKFGRDTFETLTVPGLQGLTLRAPRVVPPA